MLNGIDVSTYQKKVNWERVKPHIDFAILRCGFGSDYPHQDDNQFERNVTECKRLNIPFAVYLYSYATTEAMIESEVAHALRLIGDNKPFCVFIDMEDGKTASLGKATLTAFAKKFCEGVKAKGFNAGVYANQNWFRNYLDVKALRGCGYTIWCAKYSTAEPKIDAEFDIWQYSSSGTVDGIEGRVDMNKMYNDIRNVEEKKAEISSFPSVLEWQKAAIADGFKFPKYGADGKWGAECESVAKNAIVKRRNTYMYKNLTKIVQRVVGVEVDGLCGIATDTAIKTYQQKQCLSVDGCVGVNTWKRILGI